MLPPYSPSRFVVTTLRLFTPTLMVLVLFRPVRVLVTPVRPVSTLREGTLPNNVPKLMVAPAQRDRLMGAIEGSCTPVTLDQASPPYSPSRFVVTTLRLFTPTLMVLVLFRPVRVLVTPVKTREHAQGRNRYGNNVPKLMVAPAQRAYRLIGAIEGSCTPVTLTGVTAVQPKQIRRHHVEVVHPYADGARAVQTCQGVSYPGQTRQDSSGRVHAAMMVPKLMVAPAQRDLELIGAIEGSCTPVTLTGVTAVQPKQIRRHHVEVIHPHADGARAVQTRQGVGYPRQDPSG